MEMHDSVCALEVSNFQNWRLVHRKRGWHVFVDDPEIRNEGCVWISVRGKWGLTNDIGKG